LRWNEIFSREELTETSSVVKCLCLKLRYMSKLIFSVFILFVSFTSCKEKIKSNNLIISVVERNDLSPFLPTIKPFQSLDSLPNNLKGIVKLDSFSVQYLPLYVSKQFETQKNNSNIGIDTFNDLKFGVYAYSGFRKNQQIIIIDTNNNLDFSDDEKIIINKKLVDSIKVNISFRDLIPSRIVNYNSFENGKILKKNLLLKPLPYPDYFTYKNPTNRNNFNNKLQLVAEIKNYYYGEFKIAKSDYKVAINKSIFGYKFLIQDLNTEFLNKSNKNYRVYKLKDTIVLSDLYYRVDSLNVENHILYFKQININFKRNGEAIGDKIKNYKLIDIYEKRLSIYELTQEKKYLLIDFWGTWCAPCKELTPVLVKLNLNYPNDLNILSVAYDKRKEPLLDYIKSKNMNWNHIFIEGNAKSLSESPELLKNLRIEEYPTFILVNNENKIIYRGVGKVALDKVEQILEEK